MEIDDQKCARKHLSKLGFAFFAGTILIIALEFGIGFIFGLIHPDGNYDYGSYVVWNMLVRFLIGYPLMILMILLVKKGAPIPQKNMKLGNVLTAFVMAYALAMVSNVIGVLITSIANALKSGAFENSLQDTMFSLNPFWLILFVCVGAPVFEELIFRKALVDRAVYCGEGAAILLSGIMFGLFHGNLNQFIYAAALGAFLAFVYIRTGKIQYTIILHALVNTMGVIGTLCLEMVMAGGDDLFGDLELVSMTYTEEFTRLLADPISGVLFLMGTIGLCGWFLLVVILTITGVIFWILKGKKLFLLPSRQISIPKGKRFAAIFLNPGMLCFEIIWILIIFSSMFIG